MRTHLKYIGKQEFPGFPPVRLWNVQDQSSPYHHSTRTVEGLKELGIIRKALPKEKVNV